MNENLVEQSNAALSENAAETGVLENERQADTLAETFTQIREIQKGGGADVAGVDGVAEEIAGRLKVDLVQLDVAKEAINFTERTTTLVEKKKTLKEKFDAAVQKALLPVATALAMNTAPVLAQESQTDRPVTTPEATLVAKSESRELKKEDIFDLSSPLNVVGEKMKAFKREMLPEELALIKEFHRKVWQERNEWAMVSGRNQQGEFVVKMNEGESHKVSMPLEITEKINNNLLLTHTHPVEVVGDSEVKQSMRHGESTLFVAPPSSMDLVLSCQSRAMNQVVDPRGVWQYSCDEKMMTAFLKPQEQLKAGIQQVVLLHALSPEDTARLQTAFSSSISQSPGEYRDEYFEMFSLRNFQDFITQSLSKGYPGLAQSATSLLDVYRTQKQDFAEVLLDTEHWNEWMLRNAAHYSDDELALRIRNLIKNAEEKGIAMSYTPFKDFPKDKSLRK